MNRISYNGLFNLLPCDVVVLFNAPAPVLGQIGMSKIIIKMMWLTFAHLPTIEIDFAIYICSFGFNLHFARITMLNIMNAKILIGILWHASEKMLNGIMDVLLISRSHLNILTC